VVFTEDLIIIATELCSE